MSNNQRKCAQYRTWSQPTMPPSAAVSILPAADLAHAAQAPNHMALVLAHHRPVAREIHASGQYTVATIATTLGVSRASIYRHLTSSAR